MESKDLVYITRRARFNAAHKLWNPEWTSARNFEVFGKCAGENWHGHNFDVYVTLKGEIDPATGYFINFHDLKAIMKERIEEPLDHKNLNMDVPWLAGKQTSTEVLAMGIWREMEAGLAGYDCALHRVRVWETENNFADYFGGA
jgi:6-pyruvoyltetrahydropterin/6-carboxytetrahydropterin synthase